MWAAGNGHPDVCRLLIHNGAQVNTQDSVSKADSFVSMHIWIYIFIFVLKTVIWLFFQTVQIYTE